MLIDDKGPYIGHVTFVSRCTFIQARKLTRPGPCPKRSTAFHGAGARAGFNRSVVRGVFAAAHAPPSMLMFCSVLFRRKPSPRPPKKRERGKAGKRESEKARKRVSVKKGETLNVLPILCFEPF